MFDQIQDRVIEKWLAVATPDERIFGLYLLSALVLAFLSWLYYRRLEKNQRPENVDKSFLAYLLDKDVFLHRSAKQDYFYFFVNAILYTGLIAQLLVGMHLFMSFFYTLLANNFGVQDTPLMESSVLSIALYTVVYILLVDFAVYLTHYAQHKIPILWEFHKVHHSAEVLNPMTLYRMHPVDLFFNGFLVAVFSGLAFALFYYLTGDTPQAYELLGLNIFVFAFYFFGYNLRHSHIWLNYPAWLSHIVISPAQHQIHHSTDPKHFDRNMGIIFAFWDKLFKTLYVPKGYEKLSYGINKNKPNPFNSVWDMYFQPFKKAWGHVYKGEHAKKNAFVFIAILLFVVGNYALFLTLDRNMVAQNAPLPSVHTEELTWTEVQSALNEGYDTIIIPTGGTEQNGPHMVLGKHNYVVRYTSEQIAKELGHTMVAPVIAYVPEGIHMDWAGTINLPENVFESVLEAAAESYLSHGFKNVVFLGDSSGNQDGQDNVANRLQERWGTKAKIIHADAYYSANNQMAWLMEEKGYTKEQIGGHAGIRDTSEMKYIYPEGLRSNPKMIEGHNLGYNGEPERASKSIGKKMIDLKIEAAVRQIRNLLNKEPEENEEEKDGLNAEEYNGVSFNVGSL